MVGSISRSGGMKGARMPWAAAVQVAPPSSVSHTPPQETATETRAASRGSTQMEWIPGKSAPPPTQFSRPGWSQRLRTMVHEVPRSPLRNSPPGMVPAHSTPGWVGWPDSRLQIRCSFHSRIRPMESFSTWPSGGSG